MQCAWIEYEHSRIFVLLRFGVNTLLACAAFAKRSVVMFPSGLLEFQDRSIEDRKCCDLHPCTEFKSEQFGYSMELT